MQIQQYFQTKSSYLPMNKIKALSTFRKLILDSRINHLYVHITDAIGI